MSDTPRTDAAEYEVPLQDDLYSDEGLRQVVPSHVARQLERELAEARAERDKWNKAWKIATGHLVNEEKESEYQLQRAERAEAEEFISFNVEGVYAGPHTPVVVWAS